MWVYLYQILEGLGPLDNFYQSPYPTLSTIIRNIYHWYTWLVGIQGNSSYLPPLLPPSTPTAVFSSLQLLWPHSPSPNLELPLWDKKLFSSLSLTEAFVIVAEKSTVHWLTQYTIFLQWYIEVLWILPPLLGLIVISGYFYGYVFSV